MTNARATLVVLEHDPRSGEKPASEHVEHHIMQSI